MVAARHQVGLRVASPSCWAVASAVGAAGRRLRCCCCHLGRLQGPRNVTVLPAAPPQKTPHPPTPACCHPASLLLPLLALWAAAALSCRRLLLRCHQEALLLRHWAGRGRARCRAALWGTVVAGGTAAAGHPGNQALRTARQQLDGGGGGGGRGHEHGKWTLQKIPTAQHGQYVRLVLPTQSQITPCALLLCGAGAASSKH